VQVNNSGNTQVEYTTQSNANSTQEAVSEVYYSQSNTNSEQENEKVKANIFTGELYNFDKIYKSVDEFKSDISNKEPKNLMDKIMNDSNAKDGVIFLGELQQNLADFYYGLDIKASFDMSVSHSYSNLTQEQISQIDFNEFLTQMLDTFTGELDKVKTSNDDELINQYQNIVNGYEFISSAYSNIKESEIENEAILEQYTSSTKPLSLEEQQKVKDEEQLKLAMEFYELDPDSNLDRFTMSLMQDGYSKDIAQQRTQAYAMVGLIPHNFNSLENQDEIKIITIATPSMTKMKETLRESYDQMSTEQITNISGRLMLDLSLPANEIFGKDKNLTPEEVQARATKYLDEKFGTKEKVLNFFNNKLNSVIAEEKILNEDFTYIKDGFNIILENIDKKYDEEK